VKTPEAANGGADWPALVELTATLRKLADRLDEATDTRMLFDAEEVARRLGCSAKTVKRLIASGDLPSVRLERLRRVRASDLDEFLKRLGA
jgi:excisionase family DNA binding protein